MASSRGSFEQGEIGPDLFRKSCEFGLEGLVSKRADRPYRAGRSKDWVKVKNRTTPELSAERLLARAEKLPPGRELESVLRKIREIEMTCGMIEWINSPGLRPPS
jgi:hypothetical protein